MIAKFFVKVWFALAKTSVYWGVIPGEFCIAALMTNGLIKEVTAGKIFSSAIIILANVAVVYETMYKGYKIEYPEKNTARTFSRILFINILPFLGGIIFAYLVRW